jgi:hypothetical protein
MFLETCVRSFQEKKTKTCSQITLCYQSTHKIISADTQICYQLISLCYQLSTANYTMLSADDMMISSDTVTISADSMIYQLITFCVSADNIL